MLRDAASPGGVYCSESAGGATLADDPGAADFFDRKKIKLLFILSEPVTAKDDESRDARCSGLIGHNTRSY